MEAARLDVVVTCCLLSLPFLTVATWRSSFSFTLDAPSATPFPSPSHVSFPPSPPAVSHYHGGAFWHPPSRKYAHARPPAFHCFLSPPFPHVVINIPFHPFSSDQPPFPPVFFFAVFHEKNQEDSRALQLLKTRGISKDAVYSSYQYVLNSRLLPTPILSTNQSIGYLELFSRYPMIGTTIHL